VAEWASYDSSPHRALADPAELLLRFTRGWHCLRSYHRVRRVKSNYALGKLTAGILTHSDNPSSRAVLNCTLSWLQNRLSTFWICNSNHLWKRPRATGCISDDIWVITLPLRLNRH
jgi:hypothetical protein